MTDIDPVFLCDDTPQLYRKRANMDYETSQAMAKQQAYAAQAAMTGQIGTMQGGYNAVPQQPQSIMAALITEVDTATQMAAELEKRACRLHSNLFGEKVSGAQAQGPRPAPSGSFGVVADKLQTLRAILSLCHEHLGSLERLA